MLAPQDGTPLFDLQYASALGCTLFMGLLFTVLALRGSLREALAALLYSTGGVAVLLASNLMQVVEFFEVMAISALLLIAFGAYDGKNFHAVLHYACIHFLSGVMLLVGAIQFSHLGYLEGIPRSLFMGGLLTSAASFPFSGWVPKSCSQTSAFGFTVLSLFTTKVALFVLLNMFRGEPAILYLGMLTTIYAVGLAVVEKNSRKLVSYGIVGQMGLLLMSVGCAVIPQSVLVAQLSFSVLCQLLFILVTEHDVPCRKHASEAPFRIRLLSVEMFGLVVSLLNFAGFPGTVVCVTNGLAIFPGIEDFGYTVYQYAAPILGLGLFVCVGLKFLGMAVARERSATTGNFRSRSAILLLSLIVLLAGAFYGQGLVLPDHKLTYTLSNVLVKVATIVGSVVFFVLFRPFFEGRYESAVGEGWLHTLFFRLVDQARNFASFTRRTIDGCNLKGDVLGVELGEQDTVLSSKEPTGLISSVLLFVMLCICVGMGLCLTL